MSKKKLTGYFIASLPFFVLFVHIWIEKSFFVALSLFALAFVIVSIVFFGIYLIASEEN